MHASLHANHAVLHEDGLDQECLPPPEPLEMSRSKETHFFQWTTEHDLYASRLHPPVPKTAAPELHAEPVCLLELQTHYV